MKLYVFTEEALRELLLLAANHAVDKVDVGVDPADAAVSAAGEMLAVAGLIASGSLSLDVTERD